MRVPKRARRRCDVEGCYKSARGATTKCKGHGGGRRCDVEGCGKSAQGVTTKCVGHGGGRRCDVEGCGKSATYEFVNRSLRFL